MRRLSGLLIAALAFSSLASEEAANAQDMTVDEALRADRDAVRTLQVQLNELKFDAGAPDGIFGPSSTRALLAFAERFPSDIPAGLTTEMLNRVGRVHASWFASPFADGGASLVSPPGFFDARGVHRSDARAESPGCEDCNVTTFMLAAGDMDGDGRDELVFGHHASDASFDVVDRDTRLSIISFSGAAGATVFPGMEEDDLPLRVHEREAVIADFNADGLGDLFVAAAGFDARPFPGEQNVLILSGSEGHRDVSGSHLPQMDDMAHGVAHGDIDADGDIDLLVITNEGAGRHLPYVLRNDGRGRFTHEEFDEILDDPGLIDLYGRGPHRAEYSTARLADLDGDDAPDLLLLARGEQFRGGVRPSGTTRSLVLFNDGSGQFSVERMIELPTDRWGDFTFTNDADVVDLDNDGAPDLVLTQSTRPGGRDWRGQFLQILMQEAPGVFVDRTAERLWPQGYELALDRIAFADKTTMIDIDSDGDLDIVTRSLSPAMVSRSLKDAIVQVGLNDGTGHFAPADPRWLAGYRDYFVRAPIAGNFGAEGAPAIASYDLFGSYGGGRDQTWGINVFTHRLR